MHYDPRRAGRLRALIDAVNDLPSVRQAVDQDAAPDEDPAHV